MSSQRYICIHGHFYQPPRENPWLEIVEVQDSAYPYHDWNARITAECYAPNTASRILDNDGFIREIVNNYSRISFNVGPTLLSWLEDNQPDVYAAILQADRDSRARFSGHGSAIAQAYNHMIMPLANQRDRETQVAWGIADFRKRFDREPEGMWLPETAVDIPTLETIAAAGIKFTILEPHQAARVRPVAQPNAPWRDVSGARIDPTMPYLCHLPSGRQINLFFYDGPVSRGVAFEGLLSDGVRFAERLTGLFFDGRTHPQLVHIATDGESYGHHHQFGEMALTYALHLIESRGSARLTNYGEFLELHPPDMQVEIVENTAWSCAHGVGRWTHDCGCNSGGRPTWNQQWRKPLRTALDWLRDTVAPLFLYRGRELFRDPWAARDAYISVVLQRTNTAVEQFLAQHATHTLQPADRIDALKLLELQRHAMLMYTSCGWFFDDLSGIETVQVIQYAARCLQLAEELFDMPLEAAFLDRLRRAQSNIPAQGNGEAIYQRLVRPLRVELDSVAAHYAIASIFFEIGENRPGHAYSVVVGEGERTARAGATLVQGTASVRSHITNEAADYEFSVAWHGGHALACGVRPVAAEQDLVTTRRAVRNAFDANGPAATAAAINEHYGHRVNSLASLFRDAQRLILDRITEETLAETVDNFAELYERHRGLMQAITELGQPLPPVLRATAEFALNHLLRLALRQPDFSLEALHPRFEEARAWGVRLDREGLQFEMRNLLEQAATQALAQPGDPTPILRLDQLLALTAQVPIPLAINLWKVQNTIYALREKAAADIRPRAATDPAAAQWIEAFERVAQRLKVRPC